MILSSPELPASDLRRLTGWEIKPEGACRGDVCVPLQGDYSLERLAARVGMPLIEDVETGRWCLGPESGTRMTSAQAPDFELPDWKGSRFRLSSLRGSKVLLVAWAPW